MTTTTYAAVVTTHWTSGAVLEMDGYPDAAQAVAAADHANDKSLTVGYPADKWPVIVTENDDDHTVTLVIGLNFDVTTTTLAREIERYGH
jgi:hypothetical protein